MKLNYEFGFLAKDCPLVSRELVNPWRLAALAVGLGILIAGSHLTPSAEPLRERGGCYSCIMTINVLLYCASSLEKIDEKTDKAVSEGGKGA